MIEDEFEWDDEKAAVNLAKHNISFEQGKGVFYDPFAIGFIDDGEDYGEERSLMIGMVEGRILTVVYTDRDERTRIISVRKADPYERRQYHEENT